MDITYSHIFVVREGNTRKEVRAEDLTQKELELYGNQLILRPLETLPDVEIIKMSECKRG